ncbi:PREDICTED: uncharacterized protein LOC105449136 [Wasmannia auropunctata]|uniref:uncharacterized protein LOC105449136 n=1 Tax=Wasmannia auropunctata TaxID=64793 RepID=UPI0005F08904|nr:PREDICTED: uncharacterized protein LOC105449136 [Wasmannia auropunctata]
MYRQILVDSSQTRLQRILWRTDPSASVNTFELTTITYGTSSASYLATRCLNHLAETYSSEFPVAAARIKRDFYMDDLLTGADTIHELKSIRNEIWNQTTDTFHFSCKLNPSESITKRTILSEAARLYDPLGFLGPITVVAKLLLQELWQSGVDWDESISQDIHACWLEFRSQLECLNQLQIPRWVEFISNTNCVQIHGFCGASQRAYGACVYVRAKIGPNKYHVKLLCSRSRVAPLKAVSLPRLELSAALLLARLIVKVSQSLNVMHSTSRRWAVVANRVGEIQRLTRIESWRHVGSAENSADILSRGLGPSQLAAAVMWWHGPAFLLADEDRWPINDFTRLKELPEERKIISTAATIDQCTVGELLNRCSNLNKACRILAYCLRFVKRNRSKESTLSVSASEVTYALSILCRVVQKQAFAAEIKALNEDHTVNSSSRLISLSPFLDETGLIRIGGRLRQSDLSFNTRHPILLPRDHRLTYLVIEHEHLRNKHAGTQATMASIRERFWPLLLQSTTRQIIQKCIICFRAKPRLSEAIMGALTSSRVTPFSHCGVDYAGPVILREGKRRNARNHKAYISIFVYFATKGVHIELVSDLTSDAFLAAFKRFISRRGRPVHMYSYNGTNFVGAQKQLKEFYKVYYNQQTRSDVEQFLSREGIVWSFIPPNASHFDGLWEAAVKSAKYYLERIVGAAHLTFEEMQTELSEIEVTLNSRPITPLSADPNDLAYLSPGHFLIGTTLSSFPQAEGPPLTLTMLKKIG